MASVITQKHKQLLQEIGLTSIQTELYLMSLRNGMLSVLELSKLTGVNRQQIYHEAERLVELGLYDITRKERRKYIPANPDRLLRLAEDRRQQLDSVARKLQDIIPALSEIQIPSRKRIVTKYYEGLDRIRQAYDEELRVCKNIEACSFTGSLEHTYEYFPAKYWEQWNERFAAQHSRARVLVHNSDTIQEFAAGMKKHGIQTRYLNNFPLKVNVDVFNNVVLIISFQDELAIWIESQVLAQSYRMIFDSLWLLARPVM